MTALAAWRARMGWTQREAAAALDVTLQTYQRWENERRLDGSHLPPPRTALLAAAALERGIKPLEKLQCPVELG